MELSAWRGQNSAGVKAMDDDHRNLLEIIQALETAAENDGSRTGPLLGKLAEDTRAHFTAEETVMANSKYPGLAMHRFKHQYLLDQIAAFVARYSKAGSALNKHALNFLRDWLTTHIQKEDLNFGLWMNEHGKK